MKNTHTPGFTAPSSIYTSGGRFRTSGGAAVGDSNVRPAMPNEGDGGTTSPDDLKKQGYDCAVAGVGFVVCSKPGAPDYYCSLGSCVKALQTKPGGLFGLGIGTGVGIAKNTGLSSRR
jgi:hypothetical protein